MPNWFPWTTNNPITTANFNNGAYRYRVHTTTDPRSPLSGAATAGMTTETGSVEASISGNEANGRIDGRVRVDNASGHTGTINGHVDSSGRWGAGASGNHRIGNSGLDESFEWDSVRGLSANGRISHRVNRNAGFSVSGSHTNGDDLANFESNFSGVNASGNLNLGWSRNNGLSGDVRGSNRIGNHRVSTHLSGAERNGSFSGTVTDSWTHNNRSASLSGGLNGNDDSVGGNLAGSLGFANLFGTNAGLNLGGNSRATFDRRRKVALGSDALSEIRKEVLRKAPRGSEFIRYGAKAVADGRLGVKLPFAGASVSTGVTAGRTYELVFTRLSADEEFATQPQNADWEIPGNSSAVLKLSPGESFQIIGSMNHGANFGGSVSARLGAVSARGENNASYVLKGNTEIEVFRGDGNSVRLVMNAAKANNRSNKISVKVGIDSNLENFVGMNNHNDPLVPLTHAATGIASNVVDSWLSAGIESGRMASTANETLVDIRLDLSTAEVAGAYERAVQGDWSELEALAIKGHSGVDINKSIFSKLNETTLARARHGFGSRVENNTHETHRVSDVVVNGNAYAIESDLDLNYNRHSNWFSNHDYTVSDFSRSVRGIMGAPMNGLVGNENWLTWKHNASEEFTSKEALRNSLGLVRYLVDGEPAVKLADYDASIDRVPERRRMWAGPRNELSKTSLTTQVVIADAGLDRICNYSEERYWDAYAAAWRGIYPQSSEPAWVNPIHRRALSMHGPMSDNVADFAELYRVEVLIKRLVEANNAPESERNDLIRQTIHQNRGDEALMGMMAKLAGVENIRVDLRVDSTEGLGGTQHDFTLTQIGSGFGIQTEVFGGNY